MSIDLSGRVAVVTGAGAGLGRSHALALANRGASVVVNDLDQVAAQQLCDLIEEQGGQAAWSGANVAKLDDVGPMVDDILRRFGKIDILVNNAGVLRDRSFAKMDLDDFKLVLDVHVMGSVNCTKLVWDGMRAQNYGRIIFTTSSSGLYGNFGQANYSAAKMALVGLMQTLAIEGERSNIRVNCLAPSAATSMTNGLYSQEALAGLDATMVSPAIVALAAEDAPTRRIILAGAGSFEQANITMTQGIFLGTDEDSADRLLTSMDKLADRTGEMVPQSGGEQYQYEVERAQLARPHLLRA
ncbi:SDR family NAD(P)-dependent oxidoreductase [Sphingobium cupriresistens]|uniref:3-hydroxyacyl-CoA dehydrogenase n=1 Tax=Sphingobium cupriresistens LL01 TaxID=1420583 RepID=A0A0J7XZ59_9SPHN|nr:SDR family NAD(P)-dependent oxidoreductase [Sphingobium cupriresistens]KMS56812.1 3-hydroxyacyl-CoA dehydrogenase [Sphingobium cupriresistens LL01]